MTLEGFSQWEFYILGLRFNLRNILVCFSTLFAIIDIIGSVPIVVSLREKAGSIDSKRATIVAGSILILFLFVGISLLNLMGVDIYSFAIAGSFVLFLIAIEMILGIDLHKNQMPQTASIVPIAFPIIAGAGSLTSVLTSKSFANNQEIIVAIVMNMIIVYLVLKSSNRLERILGNAGISVLKKVFGIVLLSVSVKLFLENAFMKVITNEKFINLIKMLLEKKIDPDLLNSF